MQRVLQQGNLKISRGRVMIQLLKSTLPCMSSTPHCSIHVLFATMDATASLMKLWYYSLKWTSWNIWVGLVMLLRATNAHIWNPEIRRWCWTGNSSTSRVTTISVQTCVMRHQILIMFVLGVFLCGRLTPGNRIKMLQVFDHKSQPCPLPSDILTLAPHNASHFEQTWSQ